MSSVPARQVHDGSSGCQRAEQGNLLIVSTFKFARAQTSSVVYPDEKIYCNWFCKDNNFILRAHGLPLYGTLYFPMFYEIMKRSVAPPDRDASPAACGAPAASC